MKKLLATFLGTALLLGSLAGCGGSANSGSTKESSSQSTSASSSGEPQASAGEVETPDVLNLTIYNPMFGEVSPTTTLVGEKWHEMMEAHLGCTLNITWDEIPFGDFIQKMSVYMASGDWADIFNTITYPIDQVQELGTTGMILNLSQYEEYMPNYMRYVEMGDNRSNVTAPDGNMYLFNSLRISDMQGTQVCFALRFDIFEENNIPFPTTLDELYDAARTLKDLYPSSYPINGRSGELTRAMYGINNTAASIYYDGEKYDFGPADGKLKDMITYMQKLYVEGLLDPEWFTQTVENRNEKALNGTMFIAPWIYTAELTDNINSAAQGSLEWGMIPPPKGTAGNNPWIIAPSQKGAVLDKTAGIVINSKTEYPELVAKLVDYQMSDEMINLATWGVEGVTYNVADGQNRFSDEIMNADNRLVAMAKYGLYQSLSVRPGIQFMPEVNDVNFQVYPAAPSWMNGERRDDINAWEFYDNVYSGTSLVAGEPSEPSLNYTPEESQLKTETMTPVNTFIDENLAKFIAGEQSMDYWDAFVEEIKNYGDYQAILDMNNNKLAER